MSRVRFRMPTWKDGEEYIRTITSELGIDLERIDADLHINGNGFTIKCHMDDRGFASIMIKFESKEIQEMLLKYYQKYL